MEWFRQREKGAEGREGAVGEGTLKNLLKEAKRSLLMVQGSVVVNVLIGGA